MFDFSRYEEKARGMTVAALHYAVLDCGRTAEALDTMDREDGGDRAGRYRDEASVYRQELTERQKEGAR